MTLGKGIGVDESKLCICKAGYHKKLKKKLQKWKIRHVGLEREKKDKYSYNIQRHYIIIYLYETSEEIKRERTKQKKKTKKGGKHKRNHLQTVHKYISIRNKIKGKNEAKRKKKRKKNIDKQEKKYIKQALT